MDTILYFHVLIRPINVNNSSLYRQSAGNICILTPDFSIIFHEIRRLLNKTDLKTFVMRMRPVNARHMYFSMHICIGNFEVIFRMTRCDSEMIYFGRVKVTVILAYVDMLIK